MSIAYHELNYQLCFYIDYLKIVVIRTIMKKIGVEYEYVHNNI
jgi:hypothetical protein